MTPKPGLTLGLDGSVVLVTGGVRGVGKGIAETFLRAGATVITCARREPDALPAVDGRHAEFVRCDVRDPEEVTALVEGIGAAHRWLDVLVNNAGGAPFSLAAQGSPRFHRKIVELNLLAPLLVAQAASELMREQPAGGAIINVGSVSGLRPSPGTAAYGAAKAGLANLTASLAVEWAPKIRVNALAVGLVHTESADLHYGDADGVAAVAQTIPLGRLADPAEIGACAAFLASPLASYVTGATLTVHGGGERPAFLAAATAEHTAPRQESR